MKNWGMLDEPPARRQLNTGGDVPASAGPASPGGGLEMLGPSMSSTPMAKLGGAGGPTSLGAPPPTRDALMEGRTPTANDTGFKGIKKKKWTPADWEEAMQALFTRLNKGLDFNDPRTQAILNNARNTTMQGMNDRGIYGGYSESAAEGSYIGAASKLQQQQDMMALQALGMGGNYSRGLANDAYGRAMDEYGQGMEDAGGLGAGIGGGLGALGGGILGFMTGGPAGILAGAKGGYDFGSQAGAGIGQMGYSGSHPRPTYGGY